MASPPSRRTRALFDAIVSEVDSDGRLLCEHFLELPSRESLPAYYHVIDEPICIADMAAKLLPPPSEAAKVHYNYVALRQDLRLMLRNARKFNAPGCAVYRDAQAVEKVLKRACNELNDTGESDEEECYQRSVRERQLLEKQEREMCREVLQAANQAQSNARIFRSYRSPEELATKQAVNHTAGDPDLFLRGPETPRRFHARKLGRVPGVPAALVADRDAAGAGGAQAQYFVDYSRWKPDHFPQGSVPRPHCGSGPAPPSTKLGSGTVTFLLGGKPVAARLPVFLPPPIAPTAEHLRLCSLCLDPLARSPDTPRTGGRSTSASTSASAAAAAAALTAYALNASTSPPGGPPAVKAAIDLLVPSVKQLHGPGRPMPTALPSRAHARSSSTASRRASAAAVVLRPVDGAGYDAELSKAFCDAYVSGRLGTARFRSHLAANDAARKDLLKRFTDVAGVVERARLPPAELDLPATLKRAGSGLSAAAASPSPAKRVRQGMDSDGSGGWPVGGRHRRTSAGAGGGSAEPSDGSGSGSAADDEGDSDSSLDGGYSGGGDTDTDASSGSNRRRRRRKPPGTVASTPKTSKAAGKRKGTRKGNKRSVGAGAGAGAGAEAAAAAAAAAAADVHDLHADGMEWLVGDVVDMQDESGVWWLGLIVGRRATKVKVHYFSWSTQYDEWLPCRSPRLAAAHTHVHPRSTCSVCGESGLLMLCDDVDCSNAYHLACLKLKAVPRGKWLCPAH